MNPYYIFLAIILVLMSVRNIKMFLNYKKEKGFMNAYSALLKDEDRAFENMKEYYSNETVDYLKNKSKVLLAFGALNNNEEPDVYLNDLDFHSLFTKNGVYDKSSVDRNLDVFIWLAMLIAKANEVDRKDVISLVSAKMMELDSILERQLEYKVFKGYVAATSEEKNEDYNFLKALIDGDYSGLVYDKRMVGIFKRIASVFLTKNNEELDDYSKEDVKEFYKTLVGRKLIDAIDLGGEYRFSLTNAPVQEENKEEE